MSIVRSTDEKASIRRESQSHTINIHLVNGKVESARLDYTRTSNPGVLFFFSVEEIRNASRVLLDAVADIEQAQAEDEPA